LTCGQRVPYNRGAMRPPNNPGIKAWCGAALRVRRVAHNLSMDDLALTLGVTKSTIKRWEHDENAPTSEMLDKICAALDEPKPVVFSRPPKVV